MKSHIQKIRKYIRCKLFPKSFEQQNRTLANGIELLIENSIWIYTLPKSGTTFVLLFLSNYIGYLLGSETAITYDEMLKKYILHSADHKIKNYDIREYINYSNSIYNQIGLSRITHTHNYHSDCFKKVISINRNPLDYLISSYYYFYIKRNINISHPREIIDDWIDRFITIYNKQLELDTKKESLILSYEELMLKKEETLKTVLNFIGLNFDQDAFKFALKNSSKEKVKEMEEQRGETIVKKDGDTFNGSFIRSGKIGEWKEYFNDDDITKIRSKLHANNISLDEFILD